MHQVAHQYVKGSSIDRHPAVAVRIVLLGATPLDSELLSRALNEYQYLDVVAASCELDSCLALCQRLCPQVLLLDPNTGNDVVSQLLQLAETGVVGHLLVLDDRVRQGRLAALLKHRQVSYVTRQSSIEVLATCLEQMVQTGRRVFDPEVRGRIRRKSRGLTLEYSATGPSIGLLTSRELEVMTLLAQGFSVRKCAEELELAESTIDNHKSRLMKKLDIHKIVELTHLAIREGLVVV